MYEYYVERVKEMCMQLSSATIGDEKRTHEQQSFDRKCVWRARATHTHRECIPSNKCWTF